jgi:hypothetical protein
LTSVSNGECGLGMPSTDQRVLIPQRRFVTIGR